MNEYSLKLLNVHCASCISKIEGVLSKHLSSAQFTINFSDRRITVSSKIQADVLINDLSSIGYESKIFNGEDSQEEEREVKKCFKKALVAGVLGVLLFILGMSPLNPSLNDNIGQLIWFMLGLVSFFGIWFSGRHIYISAYRSLSGVLWKNPQKWSF